MKIFVIGTRGVPNIPGGVEKHCEQLYPYIVDAGHKVAVSRRKHYVSDNLSEWKGICLKDIYSPKRKSFEALVHSFLSVFEAKKWNADILHVHAVGPALVIPFAKLMGLKVVFTNHGPDYDRQKWGYLAKFMLKFGEWIGGKFADEVIVISKVIQRIMTDRCHRDSHLIYNGVKVSDRVSNHRYLDSLGVESGQYILAVARFVPEKGLHDLIAAFEEAKLGCKLVISGDADHEDDYSRALKDVASKNNNIVMTGYITGNKLSAMFSNAGLFVLPSYHEGLPISLLEALSYGVTPLVSDIPANLEVDLGQEYYFHCKDVGNLKDKLVTMWQHRFSHPGEDYFIDLVKKKYDWTVIADQTIKVYEKALQVS